MIPGARYGGGANVAFAQGQADFHKFKFPSRRWSGGWTTSAQNELDRADVAWLVSKVPSLTGPRRLEPS